MDIPEFNTNISVSVVMNGINENWQNRYFRLNGTSDTLIPNARNVQRNILTQTLCATILNNNNELVACGLCVIEHNYAVKLGFKDSYEYWYKVKCL